MSWKVDRAEKSAYTGNDAGPLVRMVKRTLWGQILTLDKRGKSDTQKPRPGGLRARNRETIEKRVA